MLVNSLNIRLTVCLVVAGAVLSAGQVFAQNSAPVSTTPPPLPWEDTSQPPPPSPTSSPNLSSPPPTFSSLPANGPPGVYAEPGGYPSPPPVYPRPGYVPILPPISAADFDVIPRFWLRTEYLLWWTKSAPLPTPLVTTGSPNDPFPGALGQPNTSILYGGESVDLHSTSGFRLDTGYWIDQEQKWGLQAGFFVLDGQSTGFSAFSDINGNPVIARPAIDARNGAEIAYFDSLAGAAAGGVTVSNWSRFYGWEINGMAKLMQTDRLRIDGLLGFRYLNLTETLEIDDQLSPLAPGALTFLGQPIDQNNVLLDFDRFQTTNNFYGGQFGTRFTWLLGRWQIEAITKMALGTTQEKAIIRGGTANVSPSGAASTATGGVLATTANIGDYYQSPFAFSPELDLNLVFQITPRLSARLGYTFIYWSNVLRPGDQVSRVVSPNLVPSDGNFGTAGPNLPNYQFQTTSYWAQGLNIGLDFHF